jgi:hypothetical protein
MATKAEQQLDRAGEDPLGTPVKQLTSPSLPLNKGREVVDSTLREDSTH